LKYRNLGKTDVKVSEISFGCWTMGGLNWVDGQPNGWANVDEGEVTVAINYAIDHGVNHFDNADVYGNGRAERMLARAFKQIGVPSTDYVIATKLGHHRGTSEHAFLPAHIRHQCEQSLINLQRDYIDLYYFHHGDFGKDGELLDDAVAAMDKLVDEGKVRVKGQSAYSSQDFARAVPKVRPAVLQSWAHALDDQFVRPGSPVSNLLDQYGMTFVAFSPLAQGRLLDKFDPANPPTFEPGDHRKDSSAFSAESINALNPKLQILKSRFGDTIEDLAAVALQYVLAQPHVACVIPGFRNRRQAACNVAGADRIFSTEDIAFIRETLQG